MVDPKYAKEIKIQRLESLFKNRPGLPSGESVLHLNIAGLKIRFCVHGVNAKRSIEFLKYYLGPFCVSDKVDVDLTLHFSFSHDEEATINHPIWNERIPVTSMVQKNEEVRFLIQRDFGAIFLKKHPVIWGWGPYFGIDNTVTIDNFLSLCLAQSFLEKEILMLHAAGVVIQEEVILFMGPSGVGKSTLANHFADLGFKILSGDRLFLKKEGNCVFAFPSSISIAGFSIGDVRRSFDKLEVKKIFLLQQRHQFYYKNSLSQDLVQDFLEQTLCFQPEFIDYKKHFNLAADILNSPHLRWGEISYPKGGDLLEFLQYNELIFT